MQRELVMRQGHASEPQADTAQAQSLDPAELALSGRPVVNSAPSQASTLQQLLGGQHFSSGLPSEPPAKRVCAEPRKISQEVPNLKDMNLIFPRVVVFDLDDTCWKGGLDRKGAKGSPYTWCSKRQTVVESGGLPLTVFPDLFPILLSLSQAGILVAIASHNSKPSWCHEVMNKFILDELSGLTFGALVPLHLRCIKCEGKHWPLKTEHLKEIAENLTSGPCTLREMLFFDDGKKICYHAEENEVTAIRTMDGLTLGHFLEGMKQYSSKAARRQKLMQNSLVAPQVKPAPPAVSSGTLL